MKLLFFPALRWQFISQSIQDRKVHRQLTDSRAKLQQRPPNLIGSSHPSSRGGSRQWNRGESDAFDSSTHQTLSAHAHQFFSGATTLLIVVFARTWWSLTAIMAVTFALPLIRYLVVFFLFGRKWLVLLGVFYPIMYFTSLLPIKFVAFFTMAQTNWGSSSRKKVVNSFCPVIPVFIWLSIIFIGLLKHGLNMKL